MELIDRAALMRKVNCKRNCNECDFYTDGDTWCDGEVYGTTIMQMPTIDAMPVVHGRWVELEPEIGLFECNLCGHKILRAKCNYCPHCGAAMDEEEK